MTEFVWKEKPRQNLACYILLKTTFNKEQKYLKLEFEKWRAICDDVGDVSILGGAVFFKLFPKTS